MYVLLHVDDLIVAHVDDEAISLFSNIISQHFVIKDLGDISYYLGIQTERNANGAFLLNQSAKIAAILDQFNMKETLFASLTGKHGTRSSMLDGNCATQEIEFS